MKLWLISQTENTGYDTYDAAIVAAETADDARKIHPLRPTAADAWTSRFMTDVWASSPDLVTAECIGEARTDMPAGLILASFNAA